MYPEYFKTNHDVFWFVVALLREDAEKLILLAADVRYSFVVIQRLVKDRLSREFVILPLKTIELNQSTLLVFTVWLGVKCLWAQETYWEWYAAIKVLFGDVENTLLRKLVLTLFCQWPRIFKLLQLDEAENQTFVQKYIHFRINKISSSLILVLGLIGVYFQNVLLNGGYGLWKLATPQKFLNFVDLALVNLELCLELRFILDACYSLSFKLITLNLHDRARWGHRVLLLVFRHQNVSLRFPLVFFSEDVEFLFVVLLEIFRKLDGVVVCI